MSRWGVKKCCKGGSSVSLTPCICIFFSLYFQEWFGLLSGLDQERLRATGSAEFKPGRAMFVTGPSADASTAGYCFCLEEPSRSPWQIGSLQAALQSGKR